MTEKINYLSQELASAKKTIEETQRISQMAEERANAAEVAQRAMAVIIPIIIIIIMKHPTIKFIYWL